MKIARIALRGSLRVRLLAGTVFWVAASLLVAGLSLDRLFRDHVADAVLRRACKSHLDQLTAKLHVDEQGRAALSMALSDPAVQPALFAGLYWQIDHLAGDGSGGDRRPAFTFAVGLASSPCRPTASADGEIHRHRLAGSGRFDARLVERSVRFEAAGELASAARWRLIVAADERLIVEPVARFSGALWLALGLLGCGLVIAVLVQVFSRSGTTAPAACRARTGAQGDGGASRRKTSLSSSMPLVEDFNGVLAHNGEIVERARTQAGNLAHALKTPLSVLANAAATTGRMTQSRDCYQPNRSALAKRQVALPSRAGRRRPLRPSARARAPALATGDRRAAADDAANSRRAPARTAGASADAESLAFRGEEQDLQEMLGNVLDNACKWTATRVEIQAGGDGENLVIRVDDDGDGIAAAARDAVLGRGVRTDQRVPGSGLGLSIVDDLAQLYGGKLGLTDSPLGGLRALLTLPAARAGISPLNANPR
jgi:signal transduction histidine kinase